MNGQIARGRLLLCLSFYCVWMMSCSGGAPEEARGSKTEEAPVDAAREITGPRPIWLDVDPAIGLPSAEVDDGIMMLQAFHSPEVVVRGVSLVFGNTELIHAIPVASDLVERFGPAGLNIFPGAASEQELGVETAAVSGLAEALRAERLVVLAVGPVTNVASLLMLYPELAEQIDTVVVVAGRRPNQEFRVGDPPSSPLRDFNFEKDVAAMQVLLDHPEVPLVMAPWEVSSKVWIRPDDVERLAATNEIGKWVAESTASWLVRWRENLGVEGFNPFDTLAMGWVTHPELMDGFSAEAHITEGVDDTDPEGKRRKPYLFVEESSEGRVLYLHTPKPEFQPLLLERVVGAPVVESSS